MAYLLPEAIGGFGLEVGQTVVYILQPIFPTGCMRLLLHPDAAFAVQLSFIYSASSPKARCSCEAEVLSLMPSSAAISLWLFCSMT